MAVAIENKLEVRNQVEAIGLFLIRYGLVPVIAWIGAMKFTAYEASGSTLGSKQSIYGLGRSLFFVTFIQQSHLFIQDSSHK
jgi:hypothetical protein